MEEKKKESIKEFLFIVISSLAVVLIIRTFVAQPFVVDGASMYPTFTTGEYLIVDQLSYNLGEPKRGDVIVFRFPAAPTRYFIKRVIGLPGETVKLEGENVFIKEVGSEDFFQLEEDYVKLQKNSSEENKLADNEYFVMGDNREASLDSRSWGPLDEKYLVGRALFRLFPVGRIDIFPGNN